MKLWRKIVIVIVIVIVAALFYFNSKYQSAEHITWGLNFSQSYAKWLGFDPMIVYKDILADLHPKKIRLMAYWEEIEPEPGKFDFKQMDEMLRLAEKSQAEVILVVGKKQPHWPECHEPDWVWGLSKPNQDQAQLDMVKSAVNHFKTFPAVKIWQVENEPLFHFGENCPKMNRGLLREEIALVKSLDSRPVLTADAGEFGRWLPTATAGADLFGTTMYRVVYIPVVGYFKYPLPPIFFQIKAAILQTITKQSLPIGVELQAEPWLSQGVLNTDLADQKALMNPKVFADNVEYARRVGFADNYLWGAEWWYWMAKKQNDWGMWTAGKNLLNE